MAEESYPIVRWQSAVQGWAAGCLAIGGLLSPLGILVQLILLAAGVFIFIDALMPNGATSPMASIVSAILGGVVTGLSAPLGFLLPWTALMVVLGGLFYLRHAKHRRQRQEHDYLPRVK
ncbi:MAG: hypothetical protein HY520_01755 [Candidatus Aenigmarchaeota archaeon]|nr:hypothetical protein [Candidatus Aenigmarchaeota archaeon]